MALSVENAETIALQAVGWLVNHDELLPVFLGSSGTSEADLRARISEPEFLGSVLDFILMDDRWVMEFTEAFNMKPETPMIARQSLPGGQATHWT